MSRAVLFMEPYGLEAVQQNKPPSSGKASAITNVQISSKKHIRHQYIFNYQTIYDPEVGQDDEWN